MIDSFKKTLQQNNELQEVVRKLKSFGITLHAEGDLTFKYMEDLSDKIGENYVFGVPLKDSLAISLAVYQEEINGHVDDVELLWINKFFDVKVTREDIKKMGELYV